MKEMCLDCYGTGMISCQVCFGTGVMPNVSVLGADCLKCKGLGIERHLLCRGTGLISEEEAFPPPAGVQTEWPKEWVEVLIPVAEIEHGAIFPHRSWKRTKLGEGNRQD